jgi:hypothetical protein
VKGRKGCPSKGRARVAVRAPGRRSASPVRTVREEAFSQLFFVFVASSFVCSVRSILSVDFWRTRFGERSAGRRRTVHFSQCVSGGSSSYVGRSAVTSRTVCDFLANSLPSPCRRSALSTADCLSPSLVELCFRFGSTLDLFLGLVGPL